MRTHRLTILVASLLLMTVAATAQQSDYEIKERFLSMYESLKRDIDSARTQQQMAQIPNRIRGLESEFTEHKTLINGALYPSTFTGMIADLRDQHNLALNKNTTIESQQVRIVQLEGQVSSLASQLDKLNIERTDLLTQLKSANLTTAQQKDLLRRLNDNLSAKDVLVNALVDSIFLPFGKNLDELTEGQRSNLGRKLQNASVIDRIQEIANDNVSFLNSTKLEAKDYGLLLSQYDQFKNRWNGLKDKLNAAVRSSALAEAKKNRGKADVPENPGAGVDAAIADWREKLDASFWAGLMDEFTSRGVQIAPFKDPGSFSASVRFYVDSVQKSQADASTFVNEVWIQRVDKDWRSALESESMLGRLEYASLDRAVSQLHKEKFDWKIIFYIVNVLAIVAVVWWFLTRKPKTKPAVQTATAPKANA